MKKLIILLSLSFVTSNAFAMTLKSTDIADGKKIAMKHVFNSFGCTGENVSPALSWANAPKDTKSFAITSYDPDAPTGSGWWHWLVFNIPADVTSVASGETPKNAIQSRTDFGGPGYGGPCPPPGKPHRYIFTVYALKVEKLDLDANASGAMVGYYLNQNKLAKASITAKFGR